jgi:hypothetical protein
VTFDASNRIVERLRYSVTKDSSGRYGFAILDEAGESLPVPLVARTGTDRRG